MRLVLATALLFLVGCASVPKSHNPPSPRTKESKAETASIVRSLKGQELDCVTVDGINSHLSGFREVKGRFYASVQAMASHPTDMQITTANRYPGNPKALQFWFPYGTGTMAADTFAISCGNN